MIKTNILAELGNLLILAEIERMKEAADSVSLDNLAESTAQNTEAAPQLVKSTRARHKVQTDGGAK